jgi:hypothetical protein
MNDKIIFLDFDGTIIAAADYDDPKYTELSEAKPDSSHYKFNKKSVEILNEIFHDTLFGIVVTSTHRYYLSLFDLKKICRDEGILANVVDVTPIIRTLNGNYYRRDDEIKAWIANNNFKGNFVVLDDDKQACRLMGKYFIPISMQTALTREHKKEIVSLLKGEFHVD